MNNHLKKIKIYFTTIVLFLVIGVTGSSFLIKENIHLIRNNLSQTVNYLNYKISFAQSNNKKLTATIISIFNNNDLSANSSYAKSIPVLLYHSIIEESDGENILMENFKDQMFALKKDGWQTVSIEDFYGFMKGEKNLPDKSFLLTFDDGAKKSYYPVDPLLKALDYMATSFIITKHSIGKDSGSNYYLSENELNKMIKSGRWDIQSHGDKDHDFHKIDSIGNNGHFLSNKLWLEQEGRIEDEQKFTKRINKDLAVAKNKLKERLKIEVIGFAYPFGDYGQSSINFPESKTVISDIVESLYPLSFYQVWGDYTYNHAKNDSSMIKRINIRPDWKAENLLDILENGKEKDLPYMTDFKKNDGWIKKWGEITTEGNLIIFPSLGGTSAAVILDGSYLWQNYTFRSDIYLEKGKELALFGYFKNNENFISCVYSDEYIRLEQMIAGKKKILAEKIDNFILINKTHKINMSIDNDNNSATCYLDDKIITKSYNLDKRLANGGIGFKIWDPQIDNSKIIIKNVSIEEIK